jgi:hypothetical protein
MSAKGMLPDKYYPEINFQTFQEKSTAVDSLNVVQTVGGVADLVSYKIFLV